MAFKSIVFETGFKWLFWKSNTEEWHFHSLCFPPLTILIPHSSNPNSSQGNGRLYWIALQKNEKVLQQILKHFLITVLQGYSHRYTIHWFWQALFLLSFLLHIYIHMYIYIQIVHHSDLIHIYIVERLLHLSKLLIHHLI